MTAAVASAPMSLDLPDPTLRRPQARVSFARAGAERSTDQVVSQTVSPSQLQEQLQQQRRQLDQFLAGVERRALRMAEFSIRNRDDALEAVQDAMLKLAQHYGHLPAEDWPPLFQRILQSRIMDHFRRQKVRNRLFVWFSRSDDDGDEYDPIVEAADENKLSNPLERLSLDQGNAALVDAVASLPERQRQAFLLRHWEGLSEKDTAFAMQCSEGSVKTHLSRAMQALRTRLADHA